MTGYGEKVEIEISKKKQNLTPFSGLFAVARLWEKLGLSKVIDENIAARKNRGYADAEQISAMVMLNLAGGNAPEQFNVLKESLNLPGFSLKIPSVSAIRKYSMEFHDTANDKGREKGKALIPKKKACLKGFEAVHRHLFSIAYQQTPLKEITLDQDATFIETGVKGAFYNYKGQTSFEALNLYCPEYDLMVATEYRDGNVKPGQEQLTQLKSALSQLPNAIEKIKFRSDTAGYQIDLLKFCAKGKETGYGVIDFAISCPVHLEFLKAVRSVPEKEWRSLKGTDKKQEWAEVNYVPGALSTSKYGPSYRFLAIREPLKKETVETNQLLLPGAIEYLESENENIKKLHLTNLGGNVYKIFGVVTNLIDTPGDEVISWYRGRCGKSEEVHYILKEELAGGHIISSKLGANALWWNVAVLALSLHSLVKRILLPGEVRKCRPRTLRFLFYTIAGRVIHHARQLILRLDEGIGARWLLKAWETLKSLNFSTA